MLASRIHRTLSKPRVFLIWMIIFLALIGFLVSVLLAPIKTAFTANPGLNLIILSTLAFGVLFSFNRVFQLYPEIRWVNNFRVANPGSSMQNMPVLLAPMATMLRDRTGSISLSTMSMRSIMDSIGSRLDEARDTSRYMIGLLVFLGLLGTFWGLLETIQNVGGAISVLNNNGNTADAFSELQKSLKGPLDGMGLAFSSSLFGLASSLVLGFLDLQASQAQNRFYNELEEWLSGITQISGGEDGGDEQTKNELKFAILDMQRSMAELGDRIQYGIDAASGRSDEAAKELARGIDNLVKQMRAEQKVVREWVDEQASHTSELSMVLRELSSRLGGRR